MSLGWQHYLVFPPDPNVLLFRRQLGTNPQTGLIDILHADDLLAVRRQLATNPRTGLVDILRLNDPKADRP